MKKLSLVIVALIMLLGICGYSKTGISTRELSSSMKFTKTTKPIAIFYSPHQDDELLTMGVAIKNHVEAGYEVHVVLLTDGSASNVLSTVNNRLTKEHYPTLTRSQFVEARNQEFTRSNIALGVNRGDIHFENLKDGQTTVEQMENVILKYEKMYPEAKHKTMSYIDDHNDHANVGKALLSLFNKGKVKDARFYIQDDEFINKNPKLKNYIAEDFKTNYYPSIKSAANYYMTWKPRAGYYSIGYTSVKASFDRLLNKPVSYYHKPNQNL